MGKELTMVIKMAGMNTRVHRLTVIIDEGLF